ncbi:MAG: spore coat protein CotJB [Clostridia bacterium]|nr:spore coat protein CotJB [Clostridia bacterium]
MTDSSCRERWALPFAAWDLRLYLDTHPDDRCALAAFRTLCEQAGEHSYACHGTGVCGCTDDHWHWLEGPWPWEPDANCCTRGGD